MAEQATLQPAVQRRRSTRIARNLPITVRGIDLLSQAFEERTSTIAFNVHGCKYASRHHLPKNTWVTIEVAGAEEPQRCECVRARVVWIHRPHTVRELFQIGVELERPGNIWGIVAPPPDWIASTAKAVSEPMPGIAAWPFTVVPENVGAVPGAAATESASNFSSIAAPIETPDARAPDAPANRLLRELRAELEGHLAKVVAETASQAKNEFAKALEGMEQQREAAAEAERAKREAVAADWRAKQESDAALARAEWQELLQSSLDNAAQRLAAHTAEASRTILEQAEKSVAARAEEIVRAAAGTLRTAREELAQGKASLAEMEEAARRISGAAAEIEAAGKDAARELVEKLKVIVAEHAGDLERRAEALGMGLEEHAASALEALAELKLEQFSQEADAKLAPRLEKLAGLSHEMGARESQTEESLRLYRERLRQTTENNAREAAAQLEAMLASLKEDFEATRKDALERWMKELEASGASATHAAFEGLVQSTDWHRQEVQTRLDEMSEATLKGTSEKLDSKAAEAAGWLAAELEEQRVIHAQQVVQLVEEAGDQTVLRARTDFERAAEIAAASFGEVLRGMSQNFSADLERSGSESVSRHQARLAASAGELRGNFETDIRSSLDLFAAQLVSQREEHLEESRKGLRGEMGNAVEAFRARCADEQKLLGADLERLHADSIERYRARLEAETEPWIQSSLERLGERGQSATGALARSGEEALREALARVFQGLSGLVLQSAAGEAVRAPEEPEPGGLQESASESRPSA